MKETLLLEANMDKTVLKVGIHIPNRTLRTYEEVPAHKAEIEKHCHRMVETLNRKQRKGDEDRDATENLRAVGRMLCDDLLTPRIKEQLRVSTAEYLILSLDDHLVHIPWELLYLDDAFLCRRFSTGRFVRTRQKIHGSSQRSLGECAEMWILANPGADLPSALSEGLSIFRQTRQTNREQAVINASLDSDIRPDRLRLKIKDYDILHFAGHADYVPRDPGSSGWKLTDGLFRADDVYKMAGGSPMPSLVFSNACQSARTEEWEEAGPAMERGSFGLANAFLFSGVRHYLGTFWEIMDEPSSHFALEFYRHLFSGKPVGEAVRLARLALIKAYGHDSAGWAGYLLYGDPRVSYFGPHEDTQEYPVSDSPVIPILSEGNGMTRTSQISKQFFKTEDRADESRKNKRGNIWPWLLSFFAAGLLLLSVVFVNEYMTRRNLADHAEKREEQVRGLIREISAKMSTSPSSLSPDLPNTGDMTMAITYNSVSNVYSLGKERFIASAIENEIKKQYPQIRLVERKGLKLILEELNLALSPLVPEGKKIRPRLMNARLMLMIETDRSFFRSFVSMRLFDTETGELIFSSMKKLESGRISSQPIAEKLLWELKAYEL